MILPKATYSDSYIHAMVVAVIQGAEQHIRSSLGFSILHKETGRPGESNQRPFQ